MSYRTSAIGRAFGFRNATQELVPSRVASTPEQIQNMLIARGEGAAVNESTAMRVAAVWACVRLLSDSIAMLPAALYRKDGNKHEVDLKHPTHVLINVRPNNWLTPYEFFRMAVAHVLLRGNFYAQKVTVGDRVVGLLPLNPTRMRPEQTENGDVFYIYNKGNGQQAKFKQGEILHIRGLSIDGLNGLSVLEAARNAIGLSIETEQHGTTLFRNGARPSAVLKHPAMLSDEAVKRLKDDIEERTTGANANRPLVLEEGLDWMQISMSAEDSQFIDSRKFSRSEIAMFFGVPPHAIGDLESGTSWGSGIEQQNIGFLIHTLKPYIVNISQAFIRDLIPKNEAANFVVKFDTSLLEKADFLNRQSGKQIMKRNGVINADEWRKDEGLDPIGSPESEAYKADAAPSPFQKPNENAPNTGKDPQQGK